MAGALSHAGYVTPGALRGNETNPKGFFEPRWVVQLHKELLKRSGMLALDPDPEGLAIVAERALRDGLRDEVRSWLEARFEESPQLVLKDPRLIWFLDLWTGAARDLGVEPGSVVMLRHPAEVTASRSAYYDARDVAAVAGWINVATLTEQVTRSARTVVHYPDLLADWRVQFERIGADLGARFEPAIDQRPHPVDELIDPALRRMSPDWEQVAAPRWLRDLAERTYQALLRESNGEQVDPAEFDALRTEYLEDWHAAIGMTQVERRRTIRKAERRATRAATAAASAAVGEPERRGVRDRASSAARKLLGR
ncbi:hypothetical protein GCM10009668_16080 [Nocardioides dubius]|uniref:Sulfotransferase family protein n=2 Tax=Nocardioides dubius TaxID=317019 RepID=A0ABP4EBS2_9ACTN